MNKVLIITISVLIIVTTGYTIIDQKNKEQEKKEIQIMECSKIDETEDITIKLFSEIKYLGDYVKVVKTTEEILTEDQETLDFYKKVVENTYKPYDGLEHYNYEVKQDEKSLVSTTTLDYENIDIDKLIEIDEANKKLIVNKKVKLEDFIQMYKAMNVTCKKK